MDPQKPALTGAEISSKTAALVAGFGLLIMAVIAPIANFGIFQNLFVAGDAAKTAGNIGASLVQFRVGIVLLFVVAVIDVLVAWALYILLEPVDNSLSLLAAWFRIVYAIIFAIALAHLVGILTLLGGTDYLKVFQSDQIAALVALSIGSFQQTWDLGLIIFGIHLAILGRLLLKATFFPRFIGILLLVAAAGYMTDGFGKLLLANYSISVAGFTFVGEVLLMVWLLIRGFRGTEKP